MARPLQQITLCLTSLLLCATAWGAGPYKYQKAGTINRFDYDTNGKRTKELASTEANLVLKHTFSYDDNLTSYGLSSSPLNIEATNASTEATWSSANGGVRDFDGVDDYFTGGAVADITGTALTLAAWVYPEGGANQYHDVIGKDGWSDGYRLELSSYGTALSFYLTAGSGHNLNIASVFTTNAWNHVVVTYNGTVMCAYINGVSNATTQARSGAVDTSSDDLNIGMHSNGSSYPFNGKIDDVRIYDVTFTSNQAYQLYIDTMDTH